MPLDAPGHTVAACQGSVMKRTQSTTTGSNLCSLPVMITHLPARIPPCITIYSQTSGLHATSGMQIAQVSPASCRKRMPLMHLQLIASSWRGPGKPDHWCAGVQYGASALAAAGMRSTQTACEAMKVGYNTQWDTLLHAN